MDVSPRKFQSRALHQFDPKACGLRGVSALVLVGGRPAMERFGEIPLALLDVLGRSVLMRTLDRIRATGVSEISVICDTDPLPPRTGAAGCKFSVVNPEGFWEEALRQFRSLASHSEYVLVLRLGAWAELDFAAMVNQHRRSASSVTRAYSPRNEALDMFVVSSESQLEATALLRGELCDQGFVAAPHITSGYVNLLSDPACLRNLVLDSFAGESAIFPCGRELRSGVWVGRGARVHREARVLAPAFIGSCCKVRRAALITRGSSLEHHSEVDCATVIDNSSVMPYTRVGAGLDVEHSVVGFRQVHSMTRQATVEIHDPRLIGATNPQFSTRTLMVAGRLLSLLPDALWKLLFEPSLEGALGGGAGPKALEPSMRAIGERSLASIESKTESYRTQEMVVPRRYGNE